MSPPRPAPPPPSPPAPPGGAGGGGGKHHPRRTAAGGGWGRAPGGGRGGGGGSTAVGASLLGGLREPLVARGSTLLMPGAAHHPELMGALDALPRGDVAVAWDDLGSLPSNGARTSCSPGSGS